MKPAHETLQELSDLPAAFRRAGDVTLERLLPGHREPLRTVCALDEAIWTILPYSLVGVGFDHWWASIAPQRLVYVIRRAGQLVGMSAYYNVSPADRTLTIGGTYLRPEVRGEGVNAAAKSLMLHAAFALGARRVQFLVDAVNHRSCAAMRKIGAYQEGVLRAERVTWTGRVRDTVVFSILKEEWPAVAQKLGYAPSWRPAGQTLSSC